MRLRTQLIILTLSVLILPVLIGLLIFSVLGLDRFEDGMLNPPVLIPFFFVISMLAGNAWIARSISRSFSSLSKSARRIANGDLDTPVESPGDPDAAAVAETLESLRASLKEEEARRSRLLMGLSHDIRTPVALIRGYAESLAGGIAGDEMKRRRYLDVIMGKTGELDGMVEELLEYARTSTDQRRASKTESDLHAFLVRLSREFEEDTTLGQRKFVFRDLIGRTLVAAMDERLARRVFENLISNAVRYTEPGGLVEFEIEEDDGCVVASVADDGIGIPPDETEKIFEPLYRGGNVGKRRGSGLGLSVVRSVVDGLGWTIRPSARPGRGTRFSVIIPLHAGDSDRT